MERSEVGCGEVVMVSLPVGSVASQVVLHEQLKIYC